MFSRVSRSFSKLGNQGARFAKSAAPQSVSSSRSHGSATWTKVVSGLAAGTAMTLGVAFASGEDCLQPQHYPWEFKGRLSAFDHASLRRGYEVYRQICSQCHSMELIAFRNLVGVTHTEEHAKAIASLYEIKDGPNDEGEYFDRPGKLSDKFPSPYPNEEFARYANGGAFPPDLSMISKARPRGADYIFALLTGYKEAPAGINIRDGLHYNIYFPGGAIAMAKALNDGALEFQDGTVATETQMAKDVSAFLAWASEPESDERKRAGMKWMVALGSMALLTGYYKRFKWSIFKTRKVSWRV